MRKSFLLYLFVFTALMAVIQFVNAKKMMESKEAEIERLESQLEESQLEQELLVSENENLMIFSLSSNEEAKSYLESFGLNPEEVARRIEDEIISRNQAGADNELVPFEGMEGHFRVNKIKILNHKWLIADFTDGTYWGELFISYSFNEENDLELQTEKSLLYPRN